MLYKEKHARFLNFAWGKSPDREVIFVKNKIKRNSHRRYGMYLELKQR